MTIKFTKINNLKKNFRFSFIITIVLYFLIISILLLTSFSHQLYAQQISIGFYSDFLPFPYRTTFTSITNNSFYNAFIFLGLNILEKNLIGIQIERSTFNSFSPNSISFIYVFNKDFFSLHQIIKILLQDDITELFPYIECKTNFYFDFYPLLFFCFGFEYPLYIQAIFSSVIDIPMENTFEKLKAEIEFGFYFYQLSVGLDFFYDSKLYNFDIDQDPIKYDKLQTYDISLAIKYIPTFTLFGFILNLGYSYNDLTTQTPERFLHQYIYTKIKLMFKFSGFSIDPAFGYLIYSIVSDNITNVSKMIRLYYSISVSYSF